MREFFQRWRRKVGVASLGLACIFAGLWLRSQIDRARRRNPNHPCTKLDHA